ncbi:glycoside hydrolase [soil metagenome]
MKVGVSDADTSATAVVMEPAMKGAAAWSEPARGLHFSAKPVADDGIEVTVTADNAQQFAWPRAPIATTDQVIFPLGEGVIFSADDEFWRKKVFDEKWDATESLSLPVWAIKRKAVTVSWMASSSFRKVIAFDPSGAVIVQHDFSTKEPEKSLTYRFYADENVSPVSPGAHFREWMIERGEFKTLAEKAAENPNVDKLRGAIHAYLWGDTLVARFDIRTDQAKAFAQQLLDASQSEDDSVPRLVYKAFDKEQRAALNECVKADWVYDYLLDQMAAGVSAALVDPEFQKHYGSLRFFVATTPEKYLAGAFPGVFENPDDWGNGTSAKMIEAIHDAGILHAKLCTEGAEAYAKRPAVVEKAKAMGYLVGTYDSYHSAHDPKYAGTDQTWSTAQMGADVFKNATLTGASGDYLKGFKKLGRKTNSDAVRPYVERRISANMEAAAYNYYFLDCDGTGEIYDDFSPTHPMSLEEDAAARGDRLRWISQKFGAVTGTEGGNAYIVPSVAVGEGIFGPYFGWGDPELTDKDSKFYRGRYYPPDAPEVNFKPVPIKDDYRRQMYDPAHRIPLYNAAFHDSIVVTQHWSNADFKYPEILQTVELNELLYLCPPMYHFNRKEFAVRKKLVMQQYAVWSPVHEKYGFARMTGFEYLDDDSLVQRTSYEGGCTITVNFGDEAFGATGVSIPPMSALIEAPGVWDSPRIYTPTASALKKND